MINKKNDVTLFIAERLKFLRDEYDITQEKLAFLLTENGYQITEDMISSFERGKVEIKVSHLEMFCNFYNVSADFIMGHIQYKNTEKIPENYTSLISIAESLKLNSKQAESISRILEILVIINGKKND